jgi:hypothetical protein
VFSIRSAVRNRKNNVFQFCQHYFREYERAGFFNTSICMYLWGWGGALFGIYEFTLHKSMSSAGQFAGAPKHKTAISSKTTPKILIKFKSNMGTISPFPSGNIGVGNKGPKAKCQFRRKNACGQTINVTDYFRTAEHCDR